MNNNYDEPLLISVEEARLRFFPCLSKGSVKRAIRADGEAKLRAFKSGRRWVVSIAEVERFVVALERTGIEKSFPGTLRKPKKRRSVPSSFEKWIQENETYSFLKEATGRSPD